MEQTNHSNFVSTLSSNKIVYVLFHNNEKTVSKLVKNIPEGTEHLYEFLPTTEQDKMLVEALNVPETPCIVVFKDCNFARYINKQLTPAKVKKFLNAT